MIAKVLEGIRVLDFSRFLAGPMCGSLLADMGAEVIRVERVGGEIDREYGPFSPSGVSMVPLSPNRNKKGITLNLQTARGLEILEALVKLSDIVIHNFSPGSQEAAILDYETMKRFKPGIILVALSAFGGYGPYKERSAFDPVIQAMSGAMSFTGFPSNPPTRAAVQYVDFCTGIYAALGAMFALYHRDRTGEGQIVDVSLFDAAVSTVAGYAVAAEYKVSGVVREQRGNHSFHAYSDAVRTKDGWVFLTILGNSMFRRLLRLLCREDMMEDSRVADDAARAQNSRLITDLISDWISGRTVAEVVQVMEENHIPCGPVNSVMQMVNDPQVKAREMIIDLDYPEIGKVPVHGVVPKLSETPGTVEKRAPTVGEHNEELYSGLLGFSSKELVKLKEHNVI